MYPQNKNLLFENEFRHFRPHYLDVDTIFGDLTNRNYSASRYPANNRVAEWPSSYDWNVYHI